MPTLLADASQFEFARPDGAAWMFVAAACIALLLWLAAWRTRARARLAEAGLLHRIAPGLALVRTGWRIALASAALVALALALMDPRGGEARETVEQRSIDIMVVVDVSRSMLAEDASPNRLARAKQFALDLVESLGSDRVGLIEFAGVPSLRCPLTFNHRSFRTQLESLSPQATIRGGSMLGDAIRLAVEALKGDGNGKAIVVLSDGEDMESEPVEAAAIAAKEHGIRTVTIAIGDGREGARIPVVEGGARRYLIHEGKEVWTRMDATLLERVADAGDGFLVEAGTAQADMEQVARGLAASLERTTRERSEISTKQPLFQLFAAIALLCLVGESLMIPRLNRGGTVP